MKRIFLFNLAIFISICSYSQTSQNSLAFDLAEPGSSQPSKNLNLDIVYLENAFPKRQYNVTITETPFVYEPLSFEGEQSLNKSTCTALEKKYNEVLDFVINEDPKKTEKDLKIHLTELNNLRKGSACTDGVLLKNIENLNSACIRTKKLPTTVKMVESNNYDVVIKAGEKDLTYSFKGKGRGRWLINYGFLFTSRGIEPSNYYTDQIGTDSFQIKKMKTANVLDLRFTPTVFFSWFLDKNLNKCWNNSLSLGLGFNFQSPVVSLGYNGMYNQNIGFSAGLAFYEHQKLNGRYTNNQILKENLQENQLYENAFYRPNIFLALNIRLGQNPFKSGDEQDKQ